MQKLVWQNSNGNEIDLTSGNYGITNWEGFSNTELNIQSQQVPFQDGAVFLDALMEQRELSVTLAMQDSGNLEERYRMRRELIHALNPKLGEGYLIYINDFISKRIKCVPQIPLFETHNSNDSGTPKASLTWTACEPYWEDIEENVRIIDFNEKPIIKNDGDVKIQVKMEILPLGIVVNPEIEVPTENKKIVYDDTINANERVVINTNNGQKTVTKGNIGLGLLIENDYFISVIYSERLGMFIGITNAHLLKTSYNSVDWTDINYGTIERFETLVEVNNYIYVLFQGVGFLRSEDGINWEKFIISSSSSTMVFSGLAYSDKLNLYIGSGYYRATGGSILFISEDGKNFTMQTNVQNFSNIRSVTWDSEEEIFVASSYGNISTSEDGYVWTQQSLPSEVQNSYINKVVYSKRHNLLFAFTSYYVIKSDDGINWEIALYSASGGIVGQIRDIAVTEMNDAIICVAEKKYFISIDGENWNTVTDTSSDFRTCALTYSIGAYIYSIKTNKAEILKTTDYNSFNLLLSKERCEGNTACYVNNKVFILGSTGKFFYYEDFKTPIEVSVAGEQYRFNQIEYINGIYILISLFNIYTSTNLTDWVLKYTVQSDQFMQVRYFAEKDLIIVRGMKKTYVTENFENWESSEDIVGDHTTTGICYYNKQDIFILTSYNEDKVYTSEDGINWEGHTATIPYQPFNGAGVSAIEYFPDQDIFILSARGTGSKSIYAGRNYLDFTSCVTVYDYGSFAEIIFSKEYNAFIAVTENTPSYMSLNGFDWDSVENIKGSRIFEIDNNIAVYSGNNILIEQQQEGIENVIANLSQNSDMTLGLNIGENLFRLNATDGVFNVILKYRQKYIGV